MELKINKDRVSHIKIYDFYKMNYIWCDEKSIKFLWIFNDGKLEEGYWKNGVQSSFNWMMDEEEVKNCIDKDGVLIEKPRIQIYTGKYLIKVKHFDSLEEAKNFCIVNFPNVDITFK